MNRPDEAPWYHDGLCFSCTQCGDCCTGEPGFVWVDAEQIAALAALRGETTVEFTRRHVRRVGGRLSLIEKPNGDCVFWDRETGCVVYPARPLQCRTWPFWPEIIATADDWRRTGRVCPGVGCGTHHDRAAIDDAAAQTDRNRTP